MNTMGGRLLIMLKPETARYGANLPLHMRHTFCRWVAGQALRAAQEKGKDAIRVLTPGCECEFPVAALATYLRPRLPWAGSTVRAGSVRSHMKLGNVFEERIQTWPGVTVSPRLAEGAN
jgi:hypothetical protein